MPHSPFGHGIGVATAVLVTLLFTAPLRADLEMKVGSVRAAPGTFGNSFDIELTNYGAAAIEIGGFSLVLESSDPILTFTEINNATALPYIFSGNSLFGPVIGPFLLPAGQTVDASDIAAGAAGFSRLLNPGETVGLGHVLFDIGAAAGEQEIAVRLRGFPDTTLSDEVGQSVTFTSVDGSVSVVPEPSTGVLVATLLLAVAGIRRRTAARRTAGS